MKKKALFFLFILGGLYLIKEQDSPIEGKYDSSVNLIASSQERIKNNKESNLRKTSLAGLKVKEKDSEKKVSKRLFRSISDGDLKEVIELLSKGADLEARDVYGNTALLKALDEEKLDIAKLLLKNGADPLVTNNEGVSVAMVAALQFESELFQELVSKGASANPKVLGKMNLLMNLAMEGNLEMVSFICIKKPDEVNLQDEFGNTALHYAVQGGHAEVIKVLIDHKAQINVKNVKGLSPLEMAKKDGYTEIVKLLSKN